MKKTFNLITFTRHCISVIQAVSPYFKGIKENTSWSKDKDPWTFCIQYEDIKCISSSLPDPYLVRPTAEPSLAPKHGYDVNLPEISCDNKQLLSFEIFLYSWTTQTLFLFLTCFAGVKAEQSIGLWASAAALMCHGSWGELCA